MRRIGGLCRDGHILAKQQEISCDYNMVEPLSRRLKYRLIYIYIYTYIYVYIYICMYVYMSYFVGTVEPTYLTIKYTGTSIYHEATAPETVIALHHWTGTQALCFEQYIARVKYPSAVYEASACII